MEPDDLDRRLRQHYRSSAERIPGSVVAGARVRLVRDEHRPPWRPVAVVATFVLAVGLLGGTALSSPTPHLGAPESDGPPASDATPTAPSQDITPPRSAPPPFAIGQLLRATGNIVMGDWAIHEASRSTSSIGAASAIPTFTRSSTGATFVEGSARQPSSTRLTRRRCTNTQSRTRRPVRRP
jgi:hypothetical protein